MLPATEKDGQPFVRPVELCEQPGSALFSEADNGNEVKELPALSVREMP